MKSYQKYVLIAVVAASLAAGVLLYVTSSKKETITQYVQSGQPAVISPDYRDVVLPPNIAALNFVVKQAGSHYYVKIHSQNGSPIEIFSRSASIIIPQGKWHKLTAANRGRQLYFDIFVKNKNQWEKYPTIANKIADEPIDAFIVYRKIPPVHSAWRDMGIYQRNLESYKESAVLDNEDIKFGCLNCHSFCNNRPGKMMIGFRGSQYGSSELIVENGQVSKIATTFGYTSWHPSGRLAAYSINKVRQFFHSARNEVRDVVDLDSMMAYYIVGDKTVKTSPEISQKDRMETYPAWSPDGKYLYFCSAAIPWTDRDTVPPQHYDQVRYDLVRAGYDINSDKWSRMETVLSSQQTGKSMLLPRISPDGRWLLFVMCDYGCFPIYQPSSNLYIMELPAAADGNSPQYRRLSINSDQSESWHSWSSNSRWIAFSSKKDSGLFTRTYLSYVDAGGKVYKPVLMPQKDPTFYNRCLYTYTVPELITEPVKIRGEGLARVVRGHRQISVEMPVTMATPKATMPKDANQPWLGDRE